jgi:hypothetical protein
MVELIKSAIIIKLCLIEDKNHQHDKLEEEPENE